MSLPIINHHWPMQIIVIMISHPSHSLPTIDQPSLSIMDQYCPTWTTQKNYHLVRALMAPNCSPSQQRPKSRCHGTSMSKYTIPVFPWPWVRAAVRKHVDVEGSMVPTAGGSPWWKPPRSRVESPCSRECWETTRFGVHHGFGQSHKLRMFGTH